MPKGTDKAGAVRTTRQRLAIRQAFLEADRPLGPVEVKRLAGRAIRGLGAATIYRGLAR